MAKYTIEEFKYLMKFHNLDVAPVMRDGKFYGFITDDLRYTHSHCLRYFETKAYAIQLAIENLDNYIEQVKKLRSKDVVTVNVVYHDSRSPEKTSQSTGTYDQVFERLERSNDRLRYCNGCYYYFEDKEVAALYRTWQVVLPESRSFDMYYQGGIVD